MQKFALIAIIIFSFSLVISGQETISVEGTGIGINHDEALLAAKRDAIEKGIGMVLLSQTEIENFMVQRDMIVTRTTGAVKEYDIISENKVTDGTFEIKIKASLSKTSMREDLAAFHVLIESMEKPKVMIVISEENCGNWEPTNQSAENAILKFLKDPYEFDLIDPNVSASIKSSKQKMAQLNGELSAAVSIGNQNGAEVLITGTAVSRRAEGLSQNLGGMVSVQADVTLKAINCSTGRIIGSESSHAAKVHISDLTAGNQAITKAAEIAISKLLDGIIKDWQNQVNNGLPLSVNISKVLTFRQKNAILQTLKNIPGISTVRERTWDSQSSILILDIHYKGNTNGFCEKIDGFKLSSGGGSLSVTGVNGQNINLTAETI